MHAQIGRCGFSLSACPACTVNVCGSLLVYLNSCLWLPEGFPAQLITEKKKKNRPPLKQGKLLPENNEFTYHGLTCTVVLELRVLLTEIVRL